jgi:hypothetical protein
LVGLSVERPWVVIGAWLAFAAAAVAGLSKLRVDTATGSFLDRGGPEWHTYLRSVERHGGDEFLVVALSGREPFDPEGLERVRRLSERFAALPGVRRVDSLATVPLIRRDATTGALRVDALLGEAAPVPEAVPDDLASLLRADRIASESLASSDGRVLAINLVLEDDVDVDRAAIVAAVRAALEGAPAWVTGVPVFRTEVNAETTREIAGLAPLTLLLMVLLLRAGLGRSSAIASPVAAASVATLVTFGAMAAAGTKLSLSTMVLPPILLAVGTAYGIHEVLAARGLAGPELEAALRRVSFPVALSGITTAIGFAAMGTAGIRAIRELAWFGALGTLVATAAAVTLAPALLALAPPARVTTPLERWISGPLRAWLLFAAQERRGSVVAVSIALLAVSLAGIASVRASTNIIDWFEIGSPVRESYESVRRALSGITPVNVVIESESGEAAIRPDVLRAVDALARELGARPGVGKAVSIADPLRRIGALLSLDGRDVLPGDSARIEQYLVLLEGYEGLGDLLSADRRSTNVALRLDSNESTDIVAVSDIVRSFWEQHGVPGFRASTTGIMYEFARSEEAIASSQIRGLIVAGAAIGGVLLLVFRSVRLAVLAAPPNSIPIACSFGAMGFASIPLDAATVCVASIALGLAVDNTVHIVTRFSQRRRSGLAERRAAAEAVSGVLPAAVLGSGAVAVGFAVLGLSEFTLVRHLGLLTSGVVALCLLGDVILLPALLAGRREDAEPPANPRADSS